MSFVAAIALAALAAGPVERHLHLEQHYDVPAQGAASRAFVPVPQDDAWQTITGLTLDGAPYQLVRDGRYGDQAARFDVPASGAHLTVAFDVVRHERAANLVQADGKPAPNGYADSLVG